MTAEAACRCRVLSQTTSVVAWSVSGLRRMPMLKPTTTADVMMMRPCKGTGTAVLPTWLVLRRPVGVGW